MATDPYPTPHRRPAPRRDTSSEGLPRLLVVERDARLALPLVEGLSASGLVPVWHRTAESAADALTREVFGCALVVIDEPHSGALPLPDFIRSALPSLPVVVLGHDWSVAQRIGLYDAGADDEVELALEREELSARIRAVMRRSLRRRSSSGILVHGPLQLTPERRQVHWFGVDVALTHMEYRLLELLVRRGDHVFTRPELEGLLYDQGDETTSNTLEVYVHHLRRKIHPELVTTVRGCGYSIGPADGPFAAGPGDVDG